MVLYEYRRRILFYVKYNTHATYRNKTATPQNLFAVSGQKNTLTIEKFNMFSKTWENLTKINILANVRQLVWDEHRMFCIDGYSSQNYTFVGKVSGLKHRMHSFIARLQTDIANIKTTYNNRVSFTSFRPSQSLV